MNQEQNNLNPNNFNIQGNNVIPNNQPLNNQSFNQGMGVNQQPQLTPSYQQPINQMNIEQPISQPMNNTFESGTANNQNFNSKPPKKMNLGLIIGICCSVVIIFIVIMLIINFSNEKTSNNKTNVDTNTNENINQNQSNENTTIVEENQNELSIDKLRNFALQHLPTKVMVVNTGVSDDIIKNFKYADVSNNQNGSIYAWMDKGILYISNKQPNTLVVAPKNSSYLFGTNSEYASASWLINVEQIDVKYLDVSDVTDMSHMFDWYTWGEGTQNFEILGLENWDVSNVTDMDYMFHGAGKNATSFKLDLSSWNTQKLTNIADMFSFAGENSTTFEIDISNFNLSNVKYKTALWDFFSNAGTKATNWKVVIPITNENNISNTPEKIYGADEETYYEIKSGFYPKDQGNKIFTLKNN